MSTTTTPAERPEAAWQPRHAYAMAEICLALGLGIVGSRVPGVSEIVEGYGVGAVAPLEARALADAMLDLVQDTTRLEHCAAAGQAAFRRELNWEAQSTRLMAIYASLMRERRAS